MSHHISALARYSQSEKIYHVDYVHPEYNQVFTLRVTEETWKEFYEKVAQRLESQRPSNMSREAFYNLKTTELFRAVHLQKLKENRQAARKRKGLRHPMQLVRTWSAN